MPDKHAVVDATHLVVPSVRGRQNAATEAGPQVLQRCFLDHGFLQAEPAAVSARSRLGALQRAIRRPGFGPSAPQGAATLTTATPSALPSMSMPTGKLDRDGIRVHGSGVLRQGRASVPAGGAASTPATADASAEAEETALLLDDRRERRPLVVRGDELREPGPALGVDLLAGVVQVDEHARDRDVADRQAVAHQVGTVAELAFEVVEPRGQVLIDRLLDHRLVGLLAHELLADDAREEDAWPDDLDQRGVGVLLEPERTREIVRVLRIERRLRMQPLEVLADDGRIREGPVAVAPRGDLPQGTHLAVLGVGVARQHRIVVVGHTLLRQDDADLAHERRAVDTVECRHESGLARVAL